MQVTELDDGAFLVTADAYMCLQNQCYSMIDEEAAGTYRLEMVRIPYRLPVSTAVSIPGSTCSACRR